VGIEISLIFAGNAFKGPGIPVLLRELVSRRAMKVHLERTRKLIELRAKDGRDLLRRLGIPEAEAILVRNNEVVLPEEELRETDDITILSVVSGG